MGVKRKLRLSLMNQEEYKFKKLEKCVYLDVVIEEERMERRAGCKNNKR